MSRDNPTATAQQFDLGTGFALRSDADGALGLVSGPAALEQSIRLLLATRPGERRARPNWGCPLDRLSFEPMDETTFGIAARLVRDAITRFEPRAAVTHVSATQDPDSPGCLIIDLHFHDRTTATAHAMAVQVPLPHEDAS